MTYQNFNTDTAEFTAKYIVNDSSMPTELYFNGDYWYPSGITCTMDFSDGQAHDYVLGESTNLKTFLSGSDTVGLEATINCVENDTILMTA